MRNMANGQQVRAVREILSQQDIAKLRSRILELEQECEDLRLEVEELGPIQDELDEALNEIEELTESNASLADELEGFRVTFCEIETLACHAQNNYYAQSEPS